ncbi:hypothetical protein SALBM311S_04819 [Streptomyces alboniger]
MSSGSQSLAAPSASAMASTMAPISSSFRSFHTCGLDRCSVPVPVPVPAPGPGPVPGPGVDGAALMPIPAGTARRAWTRIPVATRATTVRCQGTGTAAAVAAIPADPPITVPRLKQPCSVGSTAVPVMRSTSAPSTLTATSPPPMPAPNRHSPAVTRGADGTALPTPMTTVPAMIRTVPSAITGRVPNRDTKRPEHRMPIMEPTDRPNRTRPICPVDKSS